jgi:outer membrane protein TolC
MKSLKYLTCVLLMLISGMVMAQDDLDNYLLIAAQKNPALKARFNEYMAALEVVPQVKALPDPQLAFGYFIMPVETRMGPQQLKISASQMFPWFGTLKAKENSSVQDAKAKYELFEETKSRLFNSIKSTYFNIYFNNKAINITSENIDILNTFRKLAIIKFEAGLVSSVDELRVEIEIGEMENQLSLLKDNSQVLRVMFNNLLNIDNNQTVTTPGLLWNYDFTLPKEAIRDSINRMNHQLLSLDFQQESLRFRQEIAANMGKPSFKIGIDYTIIGKGNNNLAGTDALMFPNIGITIPLYRNKYKAMVQEVAYLASAKENEATDKTNMLETLFENGWKEYLDAGRRINLYITQLVLAKKSVKLLETDYSSGNKNFEEVLRMERMVLKFNLELEKARADKQAAIAFINYLMGK